VPTGLRRSDQFAKPQKQILHLAARLADGARDRMTTGAVGPGVPTGRLSGHWVAEPVYRMVYVAPWHAFGALDRMNTGIVTVPVPSLGMRVEPR